MTEHGAVLARSTLAFTRLDLRRMPGIEPGFTLDKISPGITVIYGPNGSGKSTIARMLHQLLWPKTGDSNCSCVGHFDLDSIAWRIDFDAGRVRCQRNGVEGDLPDLGFVPVGTRDRYLLSLHELLASDNPSFAEVIRRESAGGYDLSAAKDACKFREPSTRPPSETQAAKAARSALAEVIRRQEALQQEEQNLSELRRQRDAADAATARLEILGRAKELRTRQHQLDEARLRRDQYPSAFSLMNGQEIADLQRIERELAGLRETEQKLAGEIAEANDRINATRLVDAQAAALEHAELQDRAQRLHRLESDLSGLHRDIDRAVEECAAARGRLGLAIAEDQIAALDRDGIGTLVELSDQYEAARATQRSEDEVANWLGRIEAPDDIHLIEQGLRLLGRRRALPAHLDEVNTQQHAAHTIVYMAGAIILVESLALAALIHWSLGIAIVGAFAVVWLIQRIDPAASIKAEARSIEQEYLVLDLLAPIDWSNSNIDRTVDALSQQWRSRQVELEKAQRWNGLDQRRAAAQRERESLEQQRLALAGTYGISPNYDANSLRWIVEHFGAWQRADSQRRGLEARLAKAHSQCSDEIDRISALLGRYGYAPCADAAGAQAAIVDLGSRLSIYRQATERKRHARASLEDVILPGIEHCKTQLSDIFTKLGLTSADQHLLQQWVERLPEYQTAIKAVEEATTLVKSAAASLEAHQHETTLSGEELERALREAEELAAARSSLHDRIVQIVLQVSLAKGAHDVEAALADETAAFAALREIRESQYRSVCGWEVAEFVRRRTQDNDRPAVFHRARELFLEITQGRYRLEFDERGSGSFHAVDTTTETGHTLSELSSGTRVQLLMAVRMAFVEWLEHGPKLPMLLDETLGNTDEFRAQAVIDAALEFCRSGRQIFYFTAQQDEVVKWQTRLAADEHVHWTIVDLSHIRQLPIQERTATPRIEIPALPSVPEPDGHTPEAYFDLIRVPAIDPWASSIGRLHLWYLIPEPRRLYPCLRMGVEQWGQLQNLGRLGAERLPEEIGGLLSEAEIRARIYEAILDGWQVGRGKRVDRGVIVTSRAISETFIDRVTDIADECDGDARALISALENNRVSRLTAAKVQPFRAWLIEHGYLTESPPLSPLDLRDRVLVAASADLSNGSITLDEINGILQGFTPVGVQSVA